MYQLHVSNSNIIRNTVTQQTAVAGSTSQFDIKISSKY